MHRDPFGGAGVTALGLAASRSVESGRPDRLIDDPYARQLFEAAGSRLPMRVEWPQDPTALTDGEKLHLHGSRYIGVRTRFYDDTLRAAAAREIRQAVLLGAGLDTRAQRLALPSELALFEVDSAGILDFKRRALEAAGAIGRCRLTYVGADLSGEWSAALCEAGFSSRARTVWIAEGVLPYLTGERQTDLIEAVAHASARDSSMAFDMVSSGDVHALSERSGIEMRSLLHGMGGTDALVDLLSRHGWRATSASAGSVAERYGRDLSSPFLGAGATDDPPWLDTVFVEARAS